MRRCSLYRRPTALAALVEAHLWPRSGNRPGWWLTADRVVWLCPRYARHPSHPNPPGKEVIPLFEASASSSASSRS
jgi:hypothetical protein